MVTNISSLLLNKRLRAILILGFSGGLPLALIGSTLQAWFTEAHIDLVTIGAISLLGLPYLLKPLWAPLMDYYRFPLLGRRKGWILLMQLGLIATLFLLANVNPALHARAMGGIALLVAFFSASQDISITAYQTDVLNVDERGLGAAYYIFAYRIASLVAGGLALILADFVGWKVTYEIMAALILVAMCLTYYIPMPTSDTAIDAPKSLYRTTLAAITDLLQREKIFFLLLFIIFYKFGDALALQLMTNFLLHGLGFSLSEVGLSYKAVSIVAVILGAFVGGVALTRWNIYRALLLFGIAQSVSNLTFVLLAYVGKSFTLMTLSIFIENFCGGLSTAALLAFMMSLCNSRYTASQFALLSAIASLGRVALGPLAAMMVKELGWIQFYWWSFVLCFPGIILLFLLKNQVGGYAPVAAE